MRVRAERGSASVPAVACLAVLLLVGAALGAVAALVVAHRAAQSAADLGALAAAVALADGDDGCAAAGAVAAANAARLTGCAVEGRDVRVTVAVDGPRWLGLDVDPTAEARAGPA
ncbi:Rv3654c family TadE-like protein [Nocardioides dongkuii]|uniref:Rv3654c family TadE-like protein n=1 Tax=Nocardioides dongkuii TaxID=2760089 RepID=UPI0015FB22A4|nr:Rv3654c family TadE-like protein [Nocardioides dongkuii]